MPGTVLDVTTLKQLEETGSHKALIIHRESTFSGGSREIRNELGGALSSLINAVTECIREDSLEEEMFKLNMMTAGQVNVKRRECSRRGTSMCKGPVVKEP